MKKMKTLIASFIFLFLVGFGCYDINAAIIYKSYDLGDEINVDVSDEEKESFYILIDNGDSVIALSKNIISDTTMEYDAARLYVSELEWDNVDDIALPTMQKLFGSDVDLSDSFYFSDPSCAKSEYPYWTSTAGSDNMIWTVGTNLSDECRAGTLEKNQLLYVKAMINVSKEHVEGGILTTPSLEDDSSSLDTWNEFTDYFKEHFKDEENLRIFKDSYSLDYVELFSTNEALNLSVSRGEETYETKYTYQTGILTYAQIGDKEIDNYYNSLIIKYFSEKFNYDLEKMSFYIYANEDLTIGKDGIEYTWGDLYTEDQMEEIEKEWEEYWNSLTDEEKEQQQGMGFANPSIFTKLKVDLVNGLKTYDESSISYYYVFEGANQKYVIGTTKALKFEIDAEFNLFDSVYVNGKKIDSSNYTASEGSTIITLKQEYLDKLEEGVYTLKVTFTDGEFAQTEFTIEKPVENPKTGIAIKCGLLVLVILLGAFAYSFMRKQSRFPKHN